MQNVKVELSQWTPIDLVFSAKLGSTQKVTDVHFASFVQVDGKMSQTCREV